MDNLFTWIRELGVAALDQKEGTAWELRFEYCLYSAAANFIVGYQGGMWETEKLNSRAAIVAYGDKTQRVRLSNPMNYTDCETDLRTAGAAMTIFALQGMYEYSMARGAMDQTRKIVRMMDNIKSRVGTDKTFDQNAFYRVIN